MMMVRDTVFWSFEHQANAPLARDITTDVVVVGGGMAGLSAAQAFCEKGCQVVVIERAFCGAGATGKSSGFVTPDSELPLRKMVEKYGVDEAKKLWDFVSSGVASIKKNIHDFHIECDYREEDTLVVATTSSSFNGDIQVEHNVRSALGYPGALYARDQLLHIVGSELYAGGVSYGGTFGINGYRYCRSMKQVLETQGVHIYEQTPAFAVKDHVVFTPHGTIRAQHVIVCTDYAACTPTIAQNVFPLQTFLLVSAPLSEKQCEWIFPHRPYMVWDTDLVYHYFRLTADNRLLVGGASVFDTYAGQERHCSARSREGLVSYVRDVFPHLSVDFEYMWHAFQVFFESQALK